MVHLHLSEKHSGRIFGTVSIKLKFMPNLVLKTLTCLIRGGIEVPADKLERMNKTKTGLSYKHVPQDVGTGYVAQVEVLHQLHCVVRT